MYKAFEYRLYPTRKQRDRLSSCLTESRLLYNEMLELVKAHYEQAGKFLSYYDINFRFKGRGGEQVPQSTVQTLSERLTRAMKRFFHRKELGQKVGFPRFKAANRWHSIQLRQYGSSRDVFLNSETKRLHVPRKLGHRIKVKQHRPLEGSPKMAHIVYRSDGHWYVIIISDLTDAPAKQEGNAIGLDVGLRNFIADSEGNIVENPRYFRRGARTLRRAQRKLARRKKGSKRCGKAARQAAKQHLKIARQRKDHAHKTARYYVDRYTFIACEDLRVENMLKNHHLAKAIADASWSTFKNILCFKAEEAGCRVIEVSPYYTSQRCFKCGEIVQKSLSVRTHLCPHCGYVEDRDVQAAKNILAKARAEPSGDNVGGCAVRSLRS